MERVTMSNNEVTLTQLADTQELATVVQPQDVATTDLTVDNTEPTTVVELATVVKAPKKAVRTGIKGRPLDTDGSTTMGRARQIFAQNPSLTNIQLRDEIMTATGCKKSVAATYASKVRSPSVATA